MSTPVPRVITAAIAAGATTFGAAAAVAARSEVAFRGDAQMARTTSAVYFQVARGDVVDFQLDKLDVQQMRISPGGRFSGCNPREAAHPCVSGTLNRARDRASGTVRFGKHGRWQWTAEAVGTVSMHG